MLAGCGQDECVGREKKSKDQDEPESKERQGLEIRAKEPRPISSRINLCPSSLSIAIMSEEQFIEHDG